MRLTSKTPPHHRSSANRMRDRLEVPLYPRLPSCVRPATRIVGYGAAWDCLPGRQRAAKIQSASRRPILLLQEVT